MWTKFSKKYLSFFQESLKKKKKLYFARMNFKLTIFCFYPNLSLQKKKKKNIINEFFTIYSCSQGMSQWKLLYFVEGQQYSGKLIVKNNNSKNAYLSNQILEYLKNTLSKSNKCMYLVTIFSFSITIIIVYSFLNEFLPAFLS